MKIFYSILFLTISGPAFAQTGDLKIYWSEATLLSWEDFQGVPLEKTLFHANTNTGLSYSWGLKGTVQRMELDYKVEAFFYPAQSWVQPASKNGYLLKHEQLHFDISELHARKLRKILASVDGTKLNKDSRDYLNTFYEKIDKERSAMQNAFDKETNHSLNEEAELGWRHFVEEELNKFEDFSS
ncbi:DUF922 domain-containing protein [Gillisia sp. Hel_I_86]|uniref:DUF922 domain-containing protein n=1 Tax=Gillisia sp. Hel_I_86 TaxID=1249981 RepID=UPI0011A8BF1B|nr:DUF922 domain-containing protein [Gillisia sp. Hel_I_86]